MDHELAVGMHSEFARIWEALGELANNQSIHYRGTSAIDFTTTTLPHHGDYGWQTTDDELQINCNGVIKIVGGGTGGLINVADFAGAGLEDDGTNKLQVGEGPGIDVTADDVGIGGDTILLYDNGGDPLREYAFTDGGLTSALGAMAAGDKCELPAGTLSGGPWTLAEGTLTGQTRDSSILDGQLTGGDATKLDGISIIRSEDDAGAIYGLVEGVGDITMTLNNVLIKVENATGVAAAVYMANGGKIVAEDAELRAPTGSVGHAVRISSGDFEHLSGKAIGTVSKLPYLVP